jgi:hypothetical protein
MRRERQPGVFFGHSRGFGMDLAGNIVRQLGETYVPGKEGFESGMDGVFGLCMLGVEKAFLFLDVYSQQPVYE